MKPLNTKKPLFYYEQVHTPIVSQKYRHLQRLCVAWQAPRRLYKNYATATPPGAPRNNTWAN